MVTQQQLRLAAGTPLQALQARRTQAQRETAVERQIQTGGTRDFPVEAPTTPTVQTPKQQTIQTLIEDYSSRIREEKASANNPDKIREFSARISALQTQQEVAPGSSKSAAMLIHEAERSGGLWITAYQGAKVRAAEIRQQLKPITPTPTQTETQRIDQALADFAAGRGNISISVAESLLRSQGKLGAGESLIASTPEGFTVSRKPAAATLQRFREKVGGGDERPVDIVKEEVPIDLSTKLSILESPDIGIQAQQTGEKGFLIEDRGDIFIIPQVDIIPKKLYKEVGEFIQEKVEPYKGILGRKFPTLKAKSEEFEEKLITKLPPGTALDNQLIPKFISGSDPSFTPSEEYTSGEKLSIRYGHIWLGKKIGDPLTGKVIEMVPSTGRYLSVGEESPTWLKVGTQLISGIVEEVPTFSAFGPFFVGAAKKKTVTKQKTVQTSGQRFEDMNLDDVSRGIKESYIKGKKEDIRELYRRALKSGNKDAERFAKKLLEDSLGKKNTAEIIRDVKQQELIIPEKIFFKPEKVKVKEDIVPTTKIPESQYTGKGLYERTDFYGEVLPPSVKGGLVKPFEVTETKERQIQLLKPSLKVIPLITFRAPQLEKQGLMVGQAFFQETKQKQALKVGQVFMQETKQKLQQRQIQPSLLRFRQKQLQREKLKYLQDSGLKRPLPKQRKIRRPKEPEKIKIKIPFPGEDTKEGKRRTKELEEIAYQAYIRRAGKFVKVGRGTTLGLARARGLRQAKATLAASIQIREVKTGKKVKFARESRAFRFGKAGKDPFTLVQRKVSPLGGRLASIMERRAIVAARAGGYKWY